MGCRLRIFLGAIAGAVVIGGFLGCQEQKPSGYQTYQEKRQSGYVPPESFSSDGADSDLEPIAAQLEPEPLVAPLDQPVSALAPVNVVDGSNVADILRVGKTTGGDAAAGDASSEKISKSPRKVELLVKDREFRPEGPQKALRVNYEDLDLLKVLNMDPVTVNAVDYFPEWLKHLDGQRIRIRGFMMPTFESTGLERFVLARDTGLCCFGRNPKVYDLIAVELKPGKLCDYIHLRPFDVIGTLRIDMVAEGDKPLGLYWIEDAEVVP